MEIEIALRKHELPFEWSAAGERQAERLPDAVRPADRKGRSDLTALPLVTIDGETARDFDDAVYCEPDGDGLRLMVAIADVSHYVRDGDALDGDARERGNSVYFPRRVIPMLPEALSNELCSLKPEVDRLCMVCDMAIDAPGRDRVLRVLSGGDALPRAAHLHAGVAWLMTGAADGRTGTAPPALRQHLAEPVRAVQGAARLRARSAARSISRPSELAMIFDAQGQDRADRARTAQRRPPADRGVHAGSQRLRVAVTGGERAAGAVPRPRRARRPRSSRRCANSSRSSGLTLAGGDTPTARDYAELLARIKDRSDFALLQTVMLRSLAQAQYSPDNVGHFGLAYDDLRAFHLADPPLS